MSCPRLLSFSNQPSSEIRQDRRDPRSPKAHGQQIGLQKRAPHLFVSENTTMAAVVDPNTPTPAGTNLTTVNVTLTLDTPTNNSVVGFGDATAPDANFRPVPILPAPSTTNTSTNATAPRPGGSLGGPPRALVLQSFTDLQTSNLNSAIFGFLTAWCLYTTYTAWRAYRSRRKPIYLLNGLQTTLVAIKTVCATCYATLNAAGLDCAARSPLMNVPLVLAWDSIWAIMLVKLLLFTEWKRTSKALVGAAAVAHFAVVVYGVVRRTSTVSVTGLCGDKYPLVFKHQYAIELGLEIVTTGMLLQGITSRRRGGVFASTKEVFRQLQANEHTRVFFALIFVTLKILFTYGNFSLVAGLTHAVDSARSAVVSWALVKEQRNSVARKHAAAAASKNTQSQNARSRNQSAKPGGKAGYDTQGKGDGTVKTMQNGAVRNTRIATTPPVQESQDEDLDLSFGDIPGFDYHGRDDEEGSRDALARKGEEEGDGSRETVAGDGDIV
ncbi:uncharacterized protein EV422DRAFT_511739 [Fimicolochytrium jonesii]|uniref:uncharacterized protein n=1 Tax=Fimicolochytrium jonesii TaxID=1396493 RepID=UPI0022FE52D2|nr:uncharacterized protein EV422DRAFT_511739 [Fimicolochytrium jonesii]KAI8826864.1 hypothetical protein EV422DRAFT_511739 [Fimicolochytrium jonesii]